MNNYKYLSLDNKFKFGKYKGEEIWKVIDKDCSYISWCIKNVKDFFLNNEAYKVYIKKID